MASQSLARCLNFLIEYCVTYGRLTPSVVIDALSVAIGSDSSHDWWWGIESGGSGVCES